MNLVFFAISVIGIISLIPIYFLSVEHIKLQKKFGKEKGNKIAMIFGLISGWGFFLFLFGIWVSPQPKFIIPLFLDDFQIFEIFNFSINLFHLIIAVPFISIGAWYGIMGVKETTLKVAETHRPVKVIKSGLYAKIRHPQYFGTILSHVGISILLSSFYSLLSSPFIILLIYLISWKEEKELVKEFGKEYEDYKKNVPMLLPRLREKKKNIKIY